MGLAGDQERVEPSPDGGIVASKFRQEFSTASTPVGCWSRPMRPSDSGGPLEVAPGSAQSFTVASRSMCGVARLPPAFANLEHLSGIAGSVWERWSWPTRAWSGWPCDAAG
jgi:hypothetical protein